MSTITSWPLTHSVLLAAGCSCVYRHLQLRNLLIVTASGLELVGATIELDLPELGAAPAAPPSPFINSGEDFVLTTRRIVDCIGLTRLQ